MSAVKRLRHHVRRHVELAQQFASWIEQDRRFELAVRSLLNLVCFRQRGGDELNQQLMDRLNQSVDLYLTHTSMHDRFTLRLCVGQTNTEYRHVERVWQRIQDIAKDLKSSA